jgi:hypothetical protein
LRFVGRVTRADVAKGSKSEHNAVVLDSAGGRFVLRRKGGNAFQDPELDRLVGQEIEAEGELTGRTLIATRIDIKRG